MERQPAAATPDHNNDPFAQLEDDQDFRAAYDEFDQAVSENEHPQLASEDAVEGAHLPEESAVEPMVEKIPISPEEQTEQQERARITPEVQEILNNLQWLKSDIREGAVTVRGVFSKSWAATKNVVSTPGKVRKGAAKEWAELRHDRADRKQDKARQKYEEAAALQDQSNVRIVNWYRDRKANRRFNKYIVRKQKHEQRKAVMDRKTSVYDGHVTKMEGRKTAVEQGTAERRKRAEQYRKNLMEQRIAAESRKLERQQRRTQRLELLKSRPDLTHQQREKLANRLSPETKQQIREQVITTIRAKNIQARTMVNH